MRYCMLAALAVCALHVQFQPSARAQQTQAKAGAKQPGEVGDFVIRPAVRYGRLAVFPITSKVAKHQDRYLTLREGLESGKVAIYEVGAAPQEADDDQDQPPEAAGITGSVNRLMIVNRSEKPLYLMPGEIIVGGKQDRTIAKATIVPRTEKPFPVEVYCVERGRWSRRSDADTTRLATLLEDSGQDEARAKKLAADAKRGKFVVVAGALSKLARLTVNEGKGQNAVWKDVGRVNSKTKAMTQTGAATQNYVQKDLRQKLQGYRKHVEQPIAKEERVVGVMVAVNEEILVADLFESTPLFQKLWPSLLKGYALDGITAADGKRLNRCSVKDAADSLRMLLEADVEKTEKNNGLTITTRRNGNAVGFSAGQGGFGAGVGGAGFF